MKFQYNLKERDNQEEGNSSHRQTKIMGKGTRDGAKASAATTDVYVKLPSGKTTQFDLLPSNTVQTIYTKIAGMNQDLFVLIIGFFAKRILKIRQMKTFTFCAICICMQYFI